MSIGLAWTVAGAIAATATPRAIWRMINRLRFISPAPFWREMPCHEATTERPRARSLARHPKCQGDDTTCGFGARSRTIDRHYGHLARDAATLLDSLAADEAAAAGGVGWTPRRPFVAALTVALDVA